MKYFYLVCIALFVSVTPAQSQVSKYAEDLRVQSERTQAVSRELQEMIRQGEKDPKVIASVGRRFMTEYDRAIAITDTYRNAKTRFGLQVEMDHLIEMYLAIGKGRAALAVLCGEDQGTPFNSVEVNSAMNMFADEVVPTIKELVDLQLGAQGAADFLTSPGFREAANIVAAKIEYDVKSQVEAEIKDIVGARVHLGMSLKDHILLSSRSWISRKVNNIILRMAADHFVVQILAVKILDWIGPKLKEAMRPKGNLEYRTDHAISGMEERIRNLNAFSGSQHLLEVRRYVEAAENHIKANNYLRGDIKKAGRDDLYQKLAKAETNLLRTIKLTRTRFLMDSPLAQEEFGSLIKEMRRTRSETAKLLEQLGTKPDVAVAEGGRIKGTYRWEVIPNAGIPGYNSLVKQPISLDEAKSLCIKGGYKSFDYERKAKRAYFQPVNMDDVKLKTDYYQNPYDHYTLRRE